MGDEKPTITTEEHDKLLTTGRLFHTLAADPRYRKDVLGLIKKAAPETPIPELDIEDTVNKQVETRLKPREEEVTTLRKQIDDLSKKVARKDWLESTGLTEAESEEVEAIAKEGQIGNAKTALEFWRQKQALGTPRGTRRTPPGTQEFLNTLNKVSPRDGRSLKKVATAEAERLLSTFKRSA